MTARPCCMILLLLTFMATGGCSMNRYLVLAENHLGNTMMEKEIDIRALPAWMKETFYKLETGEYRYCKAMAETVRHAWPEQFTAIADASRISAWATLFEYRAENADITRLENEKKNLLILQQATKAFRLTRKPWRGEAEIVQTSIKNRLKNREAFNAFMTAMKRSLNNNIGRENALKPVLAAYPQWAESCRLNELTKTKWQEE